MSDPSRPSSHPEFWNVRYERDETLFGAEPSAFVEGQAHRLPPKSEIVELGAGEGRTPAWLAREHGHHATAVDFSEAALATAREWATAEGLALDAVQADVRTWQPDRRWDAAIVTFLQLRPKERARLYRLLKAIVRPGGWIFAEWFRPAHLSGDYDRMGPSRMDRMVPADEVRRAFADERHSCVEAVDVDLHEGPHLRGAAAVVRATVRTAAS